MGISASELFRLASQIFETGKARENVITHLGEEIFEFTVSEQTYRVYSDVGSSRKLGHFNEFALYLISDVTKDGFTSEDAKELLWVGSYQEYSSDETVEKPITYDKSLKPDALEHLAIIKGGYL